MSMLVLRSEDILKDWLVLQVANAHEAQQMEIMAREGFRGLSSIKIGIFFLLKSLDTMFHIITEDTRSYNLFSLFHVSDILSSCFKITYVQAKDTCYQINMDD